MAADISAIEVDGDVISLDGRDPIHAESDIDADGRIRVRIRRSVSTAPGSGLSSSVGVTPRLSNISGAEIYSVNTSSDACSLQPTPRGSNFNEMELGASVWGKSPSPAGEVGRILKQVSPAVSEGQGGKDVGGKYSSSTMQSFLGRLLVSLDS